MNAISKEVSCEDGAATEWDEIVFGVPSQTVSFSWRGDILSESDIPLHTNVVRSVSPLREWYTSDVSPNRVGRASLVCWVKPLKG